MSRIVKVKNTKATSDTWVGQSIPSGEYFTIPEAELAKWSSNAKVFADIGTGSLLVNDGSDITDPTLGYQWLNGSYTLTAPVDRLLTSDTQIPKVSIYKAEGSSLTVVTHDFTDKTTWYQKSVQVSDKALSSVGAGVYASGDTFIIDATHGKIYDEDSLTTSGQSHKIRQYLSLADDRIYKVVLKDNGNAVPENKYTVDYAAGTFTVDGSYSIQGSLTASYYKATTSEFVIKPAAGKLLSIEHSEIQLTKNCVMNGAIHFEIWISNPSNPSQKIPYQMISYKSIKDFFSAGNEGSVIPAVSGMQNDVIVLPFDYVAVKTLKSSLGAELRIKIEGDVAVTGEFATATFYSLSSDE